MISLRLLPHPRRAWLTAFGCTVALSVVFLGSLLSLHEQSSVMIVTIIGMGLLTVVSAFLAPMQWDIPYRAWNKMARHYGEFMRWYVLGICYMIISLVRLTGVAPAFTRPSAGRSGWIDKSRKAGSSDGAVGHISVEQGTSYRWVQAYVSQARSSGRSWLLMLLPFLAVLSLVEAEDKQKPLSTTYTLF